MAVIQLPTTVGLRAYQFQVTLEGRLYFIQIAWNVRANAWFLSLLDAESQPLLEGKKIVVDWDLFRTLSDIRRPPGRLIAMDLEGTGQAPALEELGERVILLYQESV